MLVETQFYYLRHGQTDWNVQHRAQGQVDVPLNDVGIEQAKLAGARLRGAGIVSICCSPLLRAHATAAIIGAAIGAPIVIVPDLMEARWGSCEGQIKGPWYTDWKAGIDPAGAEPYRAFIARALSGINEALRSPGPVLIVAHGGVYWAIEHYAGLRADSDIPNCTAVLHTPPRDGADRWRARIAEITAEIVL